MDLDDITATATGITVVVVQSRNPPSTNQDTSATLPSCAYGFAAYGAYGDQVRLFIYLYRYILRHLPPPVPLAADFPLLVRSGIQPSTVEYTPQTSSLGPYLLLRLTGVRD